MGKAEYINEVIFKDFDVKVLKCKGEKAATARTRSEDFRLGGLGINHISAQISR